MRNFKLLYKTFIVFSVMLVLMCSTNFVINITIDICMSVITYEVTHSILMVFKIISKLLISLYIFNQFILIPFIFVENTSVSLKVAIRKMLILMKDKNVVLSMSYFKTATPTIVLFLIMILIRVWWQFNADMGTIFEELVCLLYIFML